MEGFPPTFLNSIDFKGVYSQNFWILDIAIFMVDQEGSPKYISR